MALGTLIHRHPRRAAASAMLEAERALHEIQRQMNGHPAFGLAGARSFAPRLQAVENEDEFVISAELPGVEAEDLEVFVEGDVLYVKGARRGPGWKAELEDEEKEKHVVRFERRVRVPGEIAEDEVKAVYRNGLLTVTIPKARPVEPEVKTIPVEVG